MSVQTHICKEEKLGPVPSIARALAMYAQAKDMCEKDVTEAMVAASEQEVEGWASKGLKVGARSAVGQAIARAFQKNPAAKQVADGGLETQVSHKLGCQPLLRDGA